MQQLQLTMEEHENNESMTEILTFTHFSKLCMVRNKQSNEQTTSNLQHLT